MSHASGKQDMRCLWQKCCSWKNCAEVVC